MSKYNQLSEKDELIKSLRSQQGKTKDSKINKLIEAKIDDIKGNKTVLK